MLKFKKRRGIVLESFVINTTMGRNIFSFFSFFLRDKPHQRPPSSLPALILRKWRRPRRAGFCADPMDDSSLCGLDRLFRGPRRLFFPPVLAQPWYSCCIWRGEREDPRGWSVRVNTVQRVRCVRHCSPRIATSDQTIGPEVSTTNLRHPIAADFSNLSSFGYQRIGYQIYVVFRILKIWICDDTLTLILALSRFLKPQ